MRTARPSSELLRPLRAWLAGAADQGKGWDRTAKQSPAGAQASGRTAHTQSPQLAGIEDQQGRPPPPPRQGLDPTGRLGHAGTQTSFGTHGCLSGGADGRCICPNSSRRSKAATASRRPWHCQCKVTAAPLLEAQAEAERLFHCSILYMS